MTEPKMPKELLKLVCDYGNARSELACSDYRTNAVLAKTQKVNSTFEKLSAYLASQQKEKELLLRFFEEVRGCFDTWYSHVDTYCVTVEGREYTWDDAYREISHSTELGAAILKELDEKKVI